MVKLSKKVVTLTLAATVVLSGGIFAATSGASSEAEKEAKFAITQYMNAVKKGDVETMAKYAKDTRYANIDEAKKDYKEIVKQNPVTKADILDVKKIDENNMLVKILLSQNHVENAEVELPMVKENGDWKIVITGQNVDANVK